MSRVAAAREDGLTRVIDALFELISELLTEERRVQANGMRSVMIW